MAKQESRTVSVAMCHSPAEGMMIQAMLTARGIHSIIPGANAASFTAAATGFSSRVLVDEADAEAAMALIAELREGEGEANEGEANDGEDSDGEASHELDRLEDDRLAEANFDADAVRKQRNRMILASVFLAVMLPFGAGHFFQRAWGRAVGILLLQIAAFSYLTSGQLRVGGTMAFLSIALDAIGSAWLATKRFAVKARPQLPAAKLLPKAR